MKVRMIKVKTPSIPSRTAAAQFIDKHGYDMEWVPVQGLYYIHDTEKNVGVHTVSASEVTNAQLDVEDPAAFMRALRSSPLADLFACAVTSQGDFRVKAPKKKSEAEAA